MNFSGISFNKDLFDEYINVYTVTKMIQINILVMVKT